MKAEHCKHEFTFSANPLVHASLFSGIGGAEVAATWLGWRNAFHCEIQEFPRRVLDYWFPNSESYEDITKTDFTKWRGRIDVLTGGFPCQPFSLAGRRKGADDDRYLWPHMLRAIREIQPTWVVAENVVGLLTMVQPSKAVKVASDGSIFETNYIYRKEQRFTLQDICAGLERAGYEVQPFVIPACAVGAPHERKRVWIVAHRNDARVEAQCRRQDEVLSHGVASDPQCERSYEMGAEVQCEQSDGFRPVSLGTERFATRGSHPTGWEGFPSQSPVCGGDDGLPFDVDDLTAPFAEWRRESIKAYGNAWVPQVAYEIFKAIQQIEQNTE